MQPPTAAANRFDVLVAILFATVLVLGIAAVVVALVMYFPGTSGNEVPLP